MKIGMCMFLWTTRIGPEHEPLLADICETGFDGVEIPVFDGGPDEYARIGRMLDGLGLDRTAVSALGDPAHDLISPDRALREAGVERMRWVLDCTAALGARTVSGPLHSVLGQFSGTGPTEDEIARAVDSQQRIGEHAASVGVTVGLEALNRFECYLVNTMADLSALLARVDHQAAAAEAGLEMKPATVLIFGNPALGTLLMQANPRVALDLPLRVLVWQDGEETKIGYLAPDALAARYDITGADETLGKIANALDQMTNKAAAAE